MSTDVKNIQNRFINRELSWIEFNRRVLAEGLRKKIPPLERLRFLSIVSSNFDEFFMVRVAALKRAVKAGGGADYSGLSPAEQLQAVQEKIRPMYGELYRCLEEEVLPALESGGLEYLRPPYRDKEGEYLESFFMKEVLPALTPLRFPLDEAEEIPIIANGPIYGSFLLEKNESGPDEGAADGANSFISVAQIPSLLDRVIFLPGAERRWALLDDLLMLHGGALYPGYTVKERMLFRVHRDSDFSVDERRDEDFIEAMEEVIAERERSPAVRMVYSPGGSILKETVARRLELAEEDAFCIEGPLNLGSLWSLVRVHGFENLKAPPNKHYPHPAFPAEQSPFDCIKAGDALLTLPYHSFDPVVRFFQEAAFDPQVISIKTALYRTSGDSPVIHALERAALNGKHVTVVVELKARFDEERNINWAVRLEKAGVIVIYGVVLLKIHAKISQVIRRESGGLVRYIHLSTGNYNDKTARQYSDLSFFTCDEDFGNDATLIFNMLSGYSALKTLRRLIMAPWALKTAFLTLIRREARRAREGAPGKITAKMNALVDPDMADALYEASQAGVRIDLNVRGICTLIPGRPGLSENIRVVSIVGHYLEHSRIFSFGPAGAEEVYISSADMMPRNLERRVELLIPILDPAIKEQVKDILDSYFKDNVQAWELQSDTEWKRVRGEKNFAAQEYLEEQAKKLAEQPWKVKQDLVVRRGIVK